MEKIYFVLEKLFFGPPRTNWGKSTNWGSYLFVMHGCVDPHALEFFVLGLIPFSHSYCTGYEDPHAFMITHLLHKMGLS